jgi:hypothetical protein
MLRVLLRIALAGLIALAPALGNARDLSAGDEPPQVEGLSAKEVAAIAAAIVAASVAAYRAGAKGPCACPDDVDRGGRRCGRRSARDRAGGWTVYCYLSDVPAAMIKARAHSGSAKK